MKHLKIFEDFHNFNIGDIVVVVNAYRSGTGTNIFKNGDICKVVEIKNDDCYLLIRNEKGSEEYHHSRIVPEEEYLSNKYNI